MVILSDPSALPLISNPAIRLLLEQRFLQLNHADAVSLPLVEFIVLEGGEAVSEIVDAAGFPVLRSLDELPFGHPDFCPCTEILEEHSYEQHRIYEMVFIGNDDGAATAIIVPDEEGISADLLALCRSWATPSVSSP